jgi:C-terminal peptidase prc
MFLRIAILLIVVGCLCPVAFADSPNDVGTMLDVLNVVAGDVEKHYYDHKLRGLDWKALVEKARADIKKSSSLGEMVGVIAALLDHLDDSHTGFVPPMLSQKAEFGFKAQSYNGKILVYEVDPKGEAQKSGLQVGDEIVAVNGYEMDPVNFRKTMWLMTTLSPRIEVYISYTRAGEPEKKVRIPAEIISQGRYVNYYSAFRVVDEQRAIQKARDEYFRRFSHQRHPGEVEYLEIKSFAVDEAQVAKLMRHAQGAKAIVMDLRGNGGGFLDAAKNAVEPFLAEVGVLANNHYRARVEAVTLKPAKTPATAPIFVLVDGGSYSAAEVVARFLQIRRKAIIIGDRTLGLVNLSRFVPEKIGARQVLNFGIYVTVARVTLEDGEELEKKGVMPDVPCAPSVDDLRAKRDPCLTKALELARTATEAAQ